MGVLSEYYRKFGKMHSDIAREYYEEFGQDVDIAHECYKVFGAPNAKIAKEYYSKFGEEHSDIAREYYKGFGQDVNMAHKYYEVFGPSNADIAKEYYSEFGKRYFKSACEYFAQFGDIVKEARQYFGVFGSSNAKIAKKYYDFFGTKEKNLAKQRSLVANYYQLFGNDIEQAKDNYKNSIEQAKDNYENSIAKAKDNYENSIAQAKDNYENSIEQAKDNYKKSIAQAKDNYKKSIEQAKDNYENGIEQASEDNYKKDIEQAKYNYEMSIAQAKDNYEKSIAQATDNYETSNAQATDNYENSIELTRLGLMPAKTPEAKQHYWSLFNDNFERAKSFYKIFGDQIPSALDDWIRGTPCTAEIAQTILSHEAVPNDPKDVPFVVSLLIKLSKDSEAKFWKQYGKGGRTAKKYVEKLKEKLEGFSGQSWSVMALNHVVYGASHEVAQWLAESGLTPSQVKAEYPEYGETDTWNIKLDDVKRRLGQTLVTEDETPAEPAAQSNRAKSKMNQYPQSQVNWSNIWPGKINPEVVAWCCKFDKTGEWVKKALHDRGPHTRHGLTNVIIARFLYCPAKVYSDKISPKTTGQVYQELSKVLKNAGSTLATNIDRQEYKEFAKRVDVLYDFLKDSPEGKDFMDTYWRMGRTANDTNEAFKERKVIYINLLQLLKINRKSAEAIRT